MRPDPMHGRCGGVVGPEDTREDLIARGFSPRAADEVIAFRDKLASQKKVSATEATNRRLGAVVGVNYYPGVECEHGFDFCPQCDARTDMGTDDA